MGTFARRTLPGNDYGPRSARQDREYLAYVPDGIAEVDYAPGRDAALSITEAAEQVSAFDVKSHGSPARVARLLGLLSRSEGIGSSTIENYSAPMSKVIAAEATGERAHDTTTPVVILDGIESVSLAVDALGDPESDVTPDKIEEVQRRLMAHSSSDYQGFRRGYVQIGGRAGDPDSADFVPPPADEVPGLVEDLCRFINRKDDTIHPIARAAIAHAQFELIHPFPDGNGRTGRSMIQAMLRRDGALRSSVLPISLSIARDDNSRNMYVRSLQSMKSDGHEPKLDDTVKSFSWFASDASGLAMRMIDDADAVYDDMMLRTRQALRSDSHGVAIVSLLSSKLGATVNSVVAELRADPNAVRRTLKALEDNGVVASRSGGKHGRVYYAAPLLSVIEDAASMPPLMDESHPLSRVEVGGFGVDIQGPGRGRPRAADRCMHPLSYGGYCMRRAGHGDGKHRSKP